MIATGYATAVLAGFPPLLITGPAVRLPPDFMGFPTFIAHAIVATTLANLILVHLLAVLYHELVRKDALLARMWFKPRAKMSPGLPENPS
jgi:cytochrome b561